MPHVVSLKLMTLNILYKVLEFHVMNFNLKGLCELSRGEHAQTAKAGVDHTTIKTHGKCWLHQPRVYCQGWLHVTCDSIHCMCNTNSLNMSFNRAINLFFTLELICKCEIQVCQVSVVTVNTHTQKKKQSDSAFAVMKACESSKIELNENICLPFQWWKGPDINCIIQSMHCLILNYCCQRFNGLVQESFFLAIAKRAMVNITACLKF